MVILVEGYTDGIGGVKYNLKLAQTTGGCMYTVIC